ncbi:hypothetical protein [Maritalea porphyrae]|nr:hypothetical protein [Maritalea porphyrae]MCZ4270738.1 hypothetical protein [Maritalea porphyrae]
MHQPEPKPTLGDWLRDIMALAAIAAFATALITWADILAALIH